MQPQSLVVNTVQNSANEPCAYATATVRATRSFAACMLISSVIGAAVVVCLVYLYNKVVKAKDKLAKDKTFYTVPFDYGGYQFTLNFHQLGAQPAKASAAPAAASAATTNIPQFAEHSTTLKLMFMLSLISSLALHLMPYMLDSAVKYKYETCTATPYTLVGTSDKAYYSGLLRIVTVTLGLVGITVMLTLLFTSSSCVKMPNAHLNEETIFILCLMSVIATVCVNLYQCFCYGWQYVGRGPRYGFIFSYIVQICVFVLSPGLLIYFSLKEGGGDTSEAPAPAPTDGAKELRDVVTPPLINNPKRKTKKT